MNNLLDQRKIGMAFGALLLVGVGIYFFQQNAEKKEQDGKSALYKIQKTFEDEMKAIPAAEQNVSKMDVDAKFPKTVSELNGVIAAKSASPRVLFEATVKLGTLYLDHEQADKAAAVLKNGVQFAKTPLQKASQFYLIGVAMERSQQFKDALAQFQEGANLNVDALKGELLLGMVRMSLKLNDVEKAKLFAEKINKELPGSKAYEVANSLVQGGK